MTIEAVERDGVEPTRAFTLYLRTELRTPTQRIADAIARHLIHRTGCALDGCQLGDGFAAGLRILTLPDAFGRPDSECYRIVANIR